MIECRGLELEVLRVPLVLQSQFFQYHLKTTTRVHLEKYPYHLEALELAMRWFHRLELGIRSNKLDCPPSLIAQVVASLDYFAVKHSVLQEIEETELRPLLLNARVPVSLLLSYLWHLPSDSAPLLPSLLAVYSRIAAAITDACACTAELSALQPCAVLRCCVYVASQAHDRAGAQRLWDAFMAAKGFEPTQSSQVELLGLVAKDAIRVAGDAPETEQEMRLQELVLSVWEANLISCSILSHILCKGTVSDNDHSRLRDMAQDRSQRSTTLPLCSAAVFE